MSLYPHTCTVYTRLGSIGDNTWVKRDLSPVRFDASAVSRRTVGGDAGTRSALVIIPKAALGGYVPPSEFDESNDAWTIKGGDMVACKCNADEPPHDAIRVESVSIVRISDEIHHLEVR